MSLDNVFMGKKVVQQIYLKNALIYQSKGWETLPSAPQVEWTKSFDAINSFPGDCAVDQENNIYIGLFNCIYKISSEGSLLWKKTISGSANSKMCIDHDNNIYIAAPDNPAKLQKLDKNGNVLATGVTSNPIDTFSDFIVDNNNLYLAGHKNNHQYDYFYVLDKSLNVIQYKNTEADALITSDNSPYIYFSTHAFLYRIEKNNFSGISNSNLPVINEKPPYDTTTVSANIIKLAMDDMGNIYYITNSYGIYKCNINTKNITKLFDGKYAMGGLCIDYQKNIYCLKYSFSGNSPYPANLVKTSCDGTLIYDTQIVKSDSDSLLKGVVIADNNGNVYFIYKNINDELLITKIINLVKKGN